MQEPSWSAAHAETLAHLQTMIRMNTVNPPGDEVQVARFLDGTLTAAGIETHLFEPAPGRAALVARLKGNGSKAGATDSARLRNWGMQALGLLPFPMDQDDEDRMHGNDERVPVASLEFGTKLIYGAILRVAQ